MGDELNDRDQAIWGSLVDAYCRFVKEGEAFLSKGVNRVGLIRHALRQVSDPVAIEMLKSLSVPELQELFPTLLRYASFGHGAVGLFRQAILALPKEWVLERLAQDVPAILESGTYDEWRRILELYEELDVARTLQLASAATAHEDPDIREAGEDYLNRLGAQR